MHNYRLFFYILFLGVHSVCAMELVDRLDNKKDVVIDIYPFWSNDYNQKIGEIQNADLKGMRSRLKNEQCLSPDASAIDHLLYLSTIRKKNREKTLFTQKQQDKFDSYVKTKNCVPWCFGINGAVIVGTSLLPLTNLVELSESLSPVAIIMIPTTIAVAGALVGLVSLYATGLLPDLSSRKADKIQDEIGRLNRNYATIAKCWIDIYFNYPEKARYIADKFDVEELKQRAQIKTYKTKAGSDLVNPLEEAWHFIKYNNILVTFTEIENYLYNKIHNREIESLGNRIDFLEKIIHHKNTEIEKLKQENI